MPIKSKSEPELLLAVRQALLIFEQVYRLPIIKRVHSDAEPSIHGPSAPRKVLAERAVRLTCCPGFGAARAESAIGKLSALARAAMFDAGITEDMRPLLWPYAMSYAAHQLSLNKR